MDVYIDKRNRIWIIDFNVFGEPTSPLLFEWTELLPLAENSQNVEDTITAIDLEDRFRVIESEADVLSRFSLYIHFTKFNFSCRKILMYVSFIK